MSRPRPRLGLPPRLPAPRACLPPAPRGAPHFRAAANECSSQDAAGLPASLPPTRRARGRQAAKLCSTADARRVHTPGRRYAPCARPCLLCSRTDAAVNQAVNVWKVQSTGRPGRI